MSAINECTSPRTGAGHRTFVNARELLLSAPLNRTLADSICEYGVFVVHRANPATNVSLATSSRVAMARYCAPSELTVARRNTKESPCSGLGARFPSCTDIHEEYRSA